MVVTLHIDLVLYCQQMYNFCLSLHEQTILSMFRQCEDFFLEIPHREPTERDRFITNLCVGLNIYHSGIHHLTNKSLKLYIMNKKSHPHITYGIKGYRLPPCMTPVRLKRRANKAFWPLSNLLVCGHCQWLKYHLQRLCEELYKECESFDLRQN